MTALEKACESYFIELLGLNSDLAGVTPVSFESDSQAIAPAVVVQAIQKNHRLDGPRGFDVEVTFLYRGTTTTADDSAKISSAVRQSIYNAKPGATNSESAFGYFLIVDETMSGSREMAKDLKKRLITVSLIARIESE